MLYDPDYIPSHTDGAEDIFLTAQNEYAGYDRLKRAGNLANSGDHAFGALPSVSDYVQAAGIFCNVASETAHKNNRSFGTVYSTLDVIQAAAMLCVYYQDRAKECDKAVA